MNTLQILTNANLRTFQNRYYSSPKYEAQENLSGITHYCEDSTLKFFKAKILKAKPIFDGAMFMLLESTSLNMENTKRGFRVTVFDVLGSVVCQTYLENAFKTSKEALKAHEGWKQSFDLEGYYKKRLEDEARRLKQEADRIEQAIQ